MLNQPLESLIVKPLPISGPRSGSDAHNSVTYRTYRILQYTTYHVIRCGGSSVSVCACVEIASLYIEQFGLM